MRLFPLNIIKTQLFVMKKIISCYQLLACWVKLSADNVLTLILLNNLISHTHF